MLLRRGSVVIARRKSRHARIARFKFINVREEEPTMVARLPQQVLLLLVLVSGTSTDKSRWKTHESRRTSRTTPSWPATSDTLRLETTTAWNPDIATPTSRLAAGLPIVQNLLAEMPRGENEIEKRLTERAKRSERPEVTENSVLEENEVARAKVSRWNAFSLGITNPSYETSREIELSVGSSSFTGATVARASSREVMLPRIPENIVPSPGTRSSTEAHSFYGTWRSQRGQESTTRATYARRIDGGASSPRRQMRHVSDVCEKFRVGDEAKREFYSPNYPDPYPNLTECVRVLEADKGMLLKLDFRDEFKLEDSPDCRFDFLEVRDGQHGYSNLLGSFCGTNFPPEITSKTRYLWLRFRSDENIEGKGFKAVWSMIPRPTYPGVPPEPEPCIRNVTGSQAIIHSSDVEDRKKLAEREGIPLDCMWNITVKEGWKIQLSFPDTFKLQRPNECDANFVDIFKERTDMPSRERNFCGSIADTVIITSNTAFVRFYAEPKALNSTFEGIMTAIRDKDKTCNEDEYDCEDATCIAAELQCNGKVNCRFRWDEDDTLCNKKKSRLIDSQHIVIILVVFSLIMFGMSFAFVFNCVRKLIRDHRIIREHIRQSREQRLDELGRKSTPCPISASRTDIRDRSSESPSLEVLPSKELLPPTTLIAQEYTKELVLEMTYDPREMNDIHQSNNVSNAAQERLQESSEEPEMRDNACQTRESLFEPRLPEPIVSPGFTTFGVRGSGSQNGTSHLHHHRHHHLHHHQHSPQRSQPSSHQSSQQSSQLSSQQSSQQSSEHSSQQQVSQCSGCSPASRGRDGSMGICPKHNPIPAPPGWSTHESSYPLHQTAPYPEPPDYSSYQRFQSPKPSREGSAYRQSPKFARQPTVGSGERYGSSLYGSGHGSGHGSTNTTPGSQHSATPKCPQPASGDPRYRAEAVIEVDQRRPFSIESTKSAPDVIATH